jgi:hypothetical protein
VLAAAVLLLPSRLIIAQDVEQPLAPINGELSAVSAANNVAAVNGVSAPTGAAESLPDAPEPQTSAPSRNPQTSPPAKRPPISRGTGSGIIALLPPNISHERLTTEDKFQIYLHQGYGPQNILLPVLRVSFIMLAPPSGYPHQWKDGGGAFGRLYGAELATSSSSRTGKFMAEVAFHEDPRYVPSENNSALDRIFHPIAFTFVDKTNSGHNTLALSNFASAAAGGFVGMAFLPNRYSDATHAEQRALLGLAGVAIRNIAAEFRPEWEPLLLKLHIPRLLPSWWRPYQPPHH